MARLGGLSSEAFSPPTGLGSILRDHKVSPGVRSARANMGFGMARAPAPQSVSVSSSPKDSFLLDAGAADDSDDLNEEDVWGMEDATDDAGSGRDFEKRRTRTFTELGLGMSPKKSVHSLLELGVSSSKTEKLIHIKRKEKLYGAADVFSTGGPMGPSLLSRNSEYNSAGGRARIPRRPSASRMIPVSGVGSKGPSQRHAEGQSAPVEVPTWSNMMGHNYKVGLVDYGGKGTKEDDDDSLPPHELLARETARSQRTTFSVCEGLGRTLKGRDLSRVRNAVWSQMGFAD